MVATARAIGDEVARAFAVDFYTELVTNRTFDDAFEMAVARIRARRGYDPRHLITVKSTFASENIADLRRCPWRLFIRDGSEAVKLLTLS